MTSIEDRIRHLRSSAAVAERSNRESLIQEVSRLILYRIETGEKNKEFANRIGRFAKDLLSFGSGASKKPLIIETEERNKIRLQKAYFRVAKTIEEMSGNRLFSLLASLKDENRLLVDILRPIPGSGTYSIRSTDGGLGRYHKVLPPTDDNPKI